MRASELDFLRLGARNRPFHKLNIAATATLLNHAMKSGLPVPNGIVLLDQGWQRLVAEGVILVQGDDVIVEGADILLERFALNDLRREVAVRGLFSAEITPHVAPHDKIKLIEALVAVWQAGRTDDTQRDLLVMETVVGQHAGIATTTQDETADQIVITHGETLRLPKLRWLQNATAAEDWQRRLQLLLRGVRRTFNLQGSDWQIEWLDDGQVCWLWSIQKRRSL